MHARLGAVIIIVVLIYIIRPSESNNIFIY